MEVKFRIFCGETIKQWEILNGLHPVQQVEFAKKQIELMRNIRELEFDSEKVMDLYSNQPDFVSMIYYGAEKYNILCEIYLNGKLSTLDEVFGDWNRSYDILDKYL
jgi:hypothetical protein